MEVKILVWQLTASGFNPNGPERFRTKAENPDSQTCDIDISNDDYMYNVFVSNLQKKISKIKKIILRLKE